MNQSVSYCVQWSSQSSSGGISAGSSCRALSPAGPGTGSWGCVVDGAPHATHRAVHQSADVGSDELAWPPSAGPTVGSAMGSGSCLGPSSMSDSGSLRAGRAVRGSLRLPGWSGGTRLVDVLACSRSSRLGACVERASTARTDEAGGAVKLVALHVGFPVGTRLLSLVRLLERFDSPLRAATDAAVVGTTRTIGRGHCCLRFRRRTSPHSPSSSRNGGASSGRDEPGLRLRLIPAG